MRKRPDPVQGERWACLKQVRPISCERKSLQQLNCAVNSRCRGPMRTLDLKRTIFRVSDFLAWQRDGSLELSPYFQRRPVWKPAAKSFFLDTVLRGLPAPVIYIRDRVDLDRQVTIREIVDGQQRLRTLFSFIDPSALRDFKSSRDKFTVNRIHNAEVAGKTYKDLSPDYKTRILGYEFSTHILPSTVEDRDVLQMFARLNATGSKLNHQEIRNAEHFGEFKTLVYDLALEQLDRWRRWGLFSEHQIARMQEVETSSDLVMTMIEGLTGKTQLRLDKLYKRYDSDLPQADEIARRFQNVMDAIENTMGSTIRDTVFSSAVYFYSLFAFVYDQMYGLSSELSQSKAKSLPKNVGDCILRVGEAFDGEDVPDYVLDAVRRASSDTGRRRTRHKYLTEQCG